MDKPSQREIVIAVTAAIVTTAVLSFVGYFSVIKANEVKIEGLQSSLSKLEAEISLQRKSSDKSDAQLRRAINITTLFITKGNPEEDFSQLYDLNHLNELPPEDLQILIFGLRAAGSEEKINELIRLLNERSSPDTTYEYDSQGRMLQVIPLGGPATTYEYDAKGNLINITEPADKK